MNKELQKLKRLKDNIVGIEMKIMLIDEDLTLVEKDIDFLENLQFMLEENIHTLKYEATVIIASEYKKIIDELRRVRKNLLFYIRKHEELLMNFDEYQQIREEYIKKYEEYKHYVDNIQSILVFDPAKRKK